MNYRRMTLFGIFLVGFLVPLYYSYQYFNSIVEVTGVKTPNVILLTIDTCQYSAVGAYGNSQVYTPFIDELCRDGVIFPRGYAPIPTTGPSHATMLTGRSPCTLGVFRNAMKYSGEYVTLPKMLRDFGYSTAAFVSGYSLTARTAGLDIGFDVYDDSWSESKLERDANAAVDSCLNWVRDNQNTPYFIWLHLFDPHSPYQEQEPYNRLISEVDTMNDDQDFKYTEEQIKKHRVNVDQAIENNDFMVLVKHPMTENTDAKTLAKNWSAYLSEISYVDAALNRFKRGMQEHGFWSKSMVLLTADHGEGFDHDYYFAHGDRLWESAVRVPWIVKTPTNFPSNIIARSVARHEDIFPTVKSYCNVPFKVVGIEGRDLRDSMEMGLIGGSVAWSTIAPPLPRKNISKGTIISVYEPNFKLMRTESTGEDQLFLLSQDPAETTDVTDKYPEVARRLGYRIDKLQRRCRIPKAKDLSKNEINQTDQLKALGYIQ